MTESLSLRRTAIADAVASALAGKEATIVDALPRALGRAEVIARCDMAVAPDGVETYRLDGVPFIEFHPPGFKTTRDMQLVITQQYRALRSVAA